MRSLLTWKEGHCMQLCWKNDLKLYLACTTDGLNKRKHGPVTGLLRKLSTRYKHKQLRMVCPVMEMHEEGAQPSFISGPQKRNVIVPVKCATKNTQFGNVMCSREWNVERSGRRRGNSDSVTVAWGKGTLVTHVHCTWSRECWIDGCKDRHHQLLHEEKVAP